MEASTTECSAADGKGETPFRWFTSPVDLRLARDREAVREIDAAGRLARHATAHVAEVDHGPTPVLPGPHEQVELGPHGAAAERSEQRHLELAWRDPARDRVGLGPEELEQVGQESRITDADSHRRRL